MAHKMGAGSTNNGRDSKSKRLGLKLFGGQQVNAGDVILRQRGNTFKAGKNVKVGRDFTLYATNIGIITFSKNKIIDVTI